MLARIKARASEIFFFGVPPPPSFLARETKGPWGAVPGSRFSFENKAIGAAVDSQGGRNPAVVGDDTPGNSDGGDDDSGASQKLRVIPGAKLPRFVRGGAFGRVRRDIIPEASARVCTGAACETGCSDLQI